MGEIRGKLYIVISAFIFGLMPLGASIAYRGGSTAMQLVFLRCTLILPVYYLLARKNGDRLKISRKESIKIHILGLSFTLALVSLYLSYHYIDTGLATTLHFMYPLLVILGCWFFYKDRVDGRVLLALILTSLGILMNMPTTSSGNFGIFLALFSALSFAVYVVYLPRSGLVELGSMSLFFHVSLAGAIQMGIFTSLMGAWSMMSLWGVVASCAFAVIVSLAAFIFQRGTILIGSQRASIFSTLEPLTGIITGAILLGDRITPISGLGLGLILLSSLILSIEK